MSFHLYRITELYSNADGSVQFIELGIGDVDGQSAWGGQSVTVSPPLGGGGGGGYGYGYGYSTTSYHKEDPPDVPSQTQTFQFPGDLPSTATANTRVLLATQHFADLGLVTPDFIVPDGFLLLTGGIVEFAGVDSVVFPALPGDGVLSLARDGTTGMNSPTNFAGVAAHVPGNPLAGGVGADTLDGTAAADFIHAGAGNDRLDGRGGTDTLRGGTGDDTYVTDGTDTLVEVAGEGLDLVQSASSWTLADHFEHLVLTGTGNTDGVGNAAGNRLTGNAGVNTLIGYGGADLLSGGAGADSLLGGSGSDVYTVTTGDIVVELAREGLDTVRSAVAWTLGANLEQLTLLGTDAIHGTGNSLSNTLRGNEAANVLAGRRGNDTLSGGGGADAFVFDTALSATANKDTITDFARGIDKIRLDDDVFTTLPLGALAPARFHSGPGVTAAQDAGDRIVYNTTTGALYYDADGTGGTAAVAFAVLSNQAAITAADFVIVA